MTEDISEKVKIAVFGAAKEPKAWTFLGWPSQERLLAEDLGDIIGMAFEDKIETLTGACIGTPDLIATRAKRYGTRVVGYSGAKTLNEHLENPNYADPDHFDELKFIDEKDVVLNGLAERSLMMIKDADALIYLGGRTGTLTEYFAAFDGSDKPMYILQGSGGAVDKLSRLDIKKQRKAGSIFKTRSAYDLVSKIDEDFKISNFNNDPEIQIISATSLCWPQYLGIDPNKKTIIVR